MANPSLGRLIPRRLSGSETFLGADGITDFNVLDFWQWSISDLVLNTTRGILAEYIVAKALGVRTDGVRDPWQTCDLRSEGDLLVEVKSRRVCAELGPRPVLGHHIHRGQTSWMGSRH